MRYTLSPEQRAERRKATAAMTKCACGNVAALHQTMCGRCASEAAECEARGQHLTRLRASVDNLVPTDPDFGVDLRAVLFDIVDAIEK